MAHLGDFDTSAVIYGKFTTYRPSTGATFTLGGTPALSVYKDNSTTQSTTGVTLTVDFDSVTGLHHFAIDTSADGTFYSAGSFFDIVITTGTVDSVSVTGSVVGSFTLRKNSALKPATAGRTLVVDAAGLADANTVKLGPSGTGTAQTARDIGASVLLSNGTGTGQLKLASGYVAMTWADIGSPTTTVNLSGTTIKNVTDVAVQQLRTLDRIDYQRGHNTAAGSTFYVDGVGGNDTTGDGTRALPYKTISKALTVCTSNAHDEIILLPNSGGGPTTITETATITVSKNYVQIRGPGRDVNVTLNTSGNVFSITGSGVQLSGMRVTTNSGASSDGVSISGGADFVSLRYLWIENSHRDAVSINVGNNCFVEDCQITGAVRDAVRISSGSGSGQYNKVLRNVIRTIGASGVNLHGSDASQCGIQHNLIRECTTAGITVASGVTGTSITDNRFAGNTVDVDDSGTGTKSHWNTFTTDASGYASINWGDIANKTTVNALTNTSIASVSGAVGSVTGNVGGNVTGSVGSVATGIPTAAAVADAVWDEAIAGHAISGSTGEALAAAGAAGDPWITALPGSYSAGQAGYILGTNLNATVSSRATQTSVDTVDDFLDTEIAAIKAKTDNLPASPAATGDIPTATENADALLARDLGSGSNAGSLNERTVRSALRHIRNKWSFSGTTLTVTKEDDSTTAWTSTVSTNAAADPITGSDPA